MSESISQPQEITQQQGSGRNEPDQGKSGQPEPRKHAYLVDSSIYIFRGWHVYSDEIVDAEGNPSNAIYGFTEFLRELLELEQPEYIACAFDARQTDSYRREIFPEYKANRPPMPDELREQIGPTLDIIRAMGLPLLIVDNIVGVPKCGPKTAAKWLNQ